MKVLDMGVRFGDVGVLLNGMPIGASALSTVMVRIHVLHVTTTRTTRMTRRDGTICCCLVSGCLTGSDAIVLVSLATIRGTTSLEVHLRLDCGARCYLRAYFVSGKQ
jgi:hypothetical protein